MQNLIADLEKNYKIEKEIGRGGMGVVYLAIDKRLGRQVAIKVLTANPDDQGSTANEIVQRFKREGRAIARLSHPNIVSIYDFDEFNGNNYMVMEFLEGKSLASLVQEKKIIPPLITS